jgi:hypothetical protein
MNLNHEIQNRDIHVKIGSEWIPININSGSEEFKQYAIAYTQYKNRPAYHREVAYEAYDGISVYRENNEHYKPTFISNRQSVFPVIDMADVKVFLTDVTNANANWFKARDYQAWAYRDFMYDQTNPQVKYYASRYSSHLFFQTSNYRDVVTIELDGLSPNIIFKISRNENGSVYYEKNDQNASRVRICDNETARSGYLGFYRRITDIGDFIITPAPVVPVVNHPTPAPVDYGPGPEYQDFAGYLHQINATAAATASTYQNHNIKLPLPPGAHSIQTDNEEEQCIMCFRNKSTLRLHPCGHKVMCPDCYNKMEKGECPICRNDIIKLTCENS